MSVRSQAGRRLAAFGLDYLLILLYIGLLALVGVWVIAPRLTLTQPGQTQLLGFTTLTLPVFLYFALSETLKGGTFGKRQLGLRVTTRSGGVLPLGHSLLRSGLKFTPWELAHTAVYCIIFWTADGAVLSVGQGIFLGICYVLSLGLSAAYVIGLFRGRPLYDWVSRTHVEFIPTHSRRLA